MNPASKCSACGMNCDVTDLRSASISSVYSLLAATDVEPDDPSVSQAWIDKRLYCARCRRIENLKRCLIAIAFLIFSTFGAVYLHNLLWG